MQRVSGAESEEDRALPSTVWCISIIWNIRV